MTEAEKVEYRKRRSAGACQTCSARKRKCKHNNGTASPESTVSARVTKPATQKSRGKQPVQHSNTGSLLDLNEFEDLINYFDLEDGSSSSDNALSSLEVPDNDALWQSQQTFTRDLFGHGDFELFPQSTPMQFGELQALSGGVPPAQILLEQPHLIGVESMISQDPHSSVNQAGSQAREAYRSVQPQGVLSTEETASLSLQASPSTINATRQERRTYGKLSFGAHRDSQVADGHVAHNNSTGPASRGRHVLATGSEGVVKQVPAAYDVLVQEARAGISGAGLLGHGGLPSQGVSAGHGGLSSQGLSTGHGALSSQGLSSQGELLGSAGLSGQGVLTGKGGLASHGGLPSHGGLFGNDGLSSQAGSIESGVEALKRSPQPVLQVIATNSKQQPLATTSEPQQAVSETGNGQGVAASTLSTTAVSSGSSAAQSALMAAALLRLVTHTQWSLLSAALSACAVEAERYPKMEQSLPVMATC